MRVVDEFLSVHMHESLHVVIERDEVIPSVVYRVKVPMTEQHWLDYNTILAQFKQACDLHNALCAGKEDFDSVDCAGSDLGADGGGIGQAEPARSALGLWQDALPS
jgi:hypothetical protein